MSRRTWMIRGAAVLAAGLVTALTPAAEEATPSGLRIGLVKTLFRDVPEALIPIGLRPMKELMVGQTGVGGDLIPSGDADSLARQLKADDVQLAVFHGVEFAWVRQNYPTLKPLVIAVNERPFLRAHLVVRADSKITGGAGLRGKVVNLPRSQDHCRLFLERRCCPSGEEPAAFFSTEEVQWCSEDALDNVLEDTAQAAVVDEVSWEAYRKSKPGCAAKLKTIQQSELFPCAVIAYQPGAVNEATLTAFRDGLVNTRNSPKTQKLLKANHITGFDSIPSDYDQMLLDIAKAYPPAAK